MKFFGLEYHLEGEFVIIGNNLICQGQAENENFNVGSEEKFKTCTNLFVTVYKKYIFVATQFKIELCLTTDVSLGWNIKQKDGSSF